VDIVTKK